MSDDASALGPESLDDFGMLEGVGVTARRELIASSEERALTEGEVLLEQGVRSPYMFLVLEGELGVFLDRVEGEPVAVIGHGETVGELSVLDGSAASAHVVARTGCRLLAVREDHFWQLTNASHAFAVNLLLKLAARLRANNATVRRNVAKRLQYERAAMFDGLTGIHNRRWLDETLGRLVQRHRRGHGALTVALIDVDYFKQFNDRHGHAAGDRVLIAVAATLGANVRPTDLVARYGGEEFVVVFPETSLADAAIAAERVRAAVEAKQVATDDGTPLPQVTISIGLAELAADLRVAELLSIADAALYRAKDKGRNRVELGP